MKIFNKTFSLADIFLVPTIYPAAYIMKAFRTAGVERMPLCRRALMRVGVYPIINHYYEPLIDYRLLARPLDEDRKLPGIDWNVSEQQALLRSFCFNDEIKDITTPIANVPAFRFNKSAFGEGDVEFLYNLVRLKKPSRVFEIGSGHSTLVAMKAIKKNKEENPSYKCKHLCIEPYEKPWLEKTGATIIRRRVEDVGKAVFSELEKGDLLFIDSSHIIRPQGDVLFEYLELLPSLNTGVIVHAHDIFSPKDYPRKWLVNRNLFWNEQYLLEAFLTNNQEWKIIGALNYLYHNHFELLQEKSPFLTRDREPGSFYIEKIA